MSILSSLGFRYSKVFVLGYVLRRAMALKALDQRLASSPANNANIPLSPSANIPKSPAPPSQINAASISASSSAPGVGAGAGSVVVERQAADAES